MLQVYDGNYSLKVTSSSPSHPEAHCDRSHNDQRGRKPLRENRIMIKLQKQLPEYLEFVFVVSELLQVRQQVDVITLLPGGDFWSSLSVLQSGLNVALQQPVVRICPQYTSVTLWVQILQEILSTFYRCNTRVQGGALSISKKRPINAVAQWPPTFLLHRPV